MISSSRTSTLLLNLLFILSLVGREVTVASESIVTGKPHTAVQNLSKDNFDQALNDPANGLWLLKFYAPWCGHCKKLAPTLDKMATYIAGKFAIGKIDCTIETSLCKDPKFNVRGYPTLKIYKDGNFYDYSGKRDPDSMIGFMEKMSQPSVSLVNSVEDFKNDVLEKSDNGVTFIAFDSKAKEMQIQSTASENKNTAEVTDVEKYIASSNFLQIYGQTSRILQASTSFALLHPSKFAEISKLFENGDKNLGSTLKKNQPLLLRIEKGTKPIIYNGDISSSENVIEWVKTNTMPLVTKLEGHNFRTVSALGKPLVIGITNEEPEETFLKELLDIAQDGPSDITQKYKFAQMNGKKFHSFLSQFNITSTSRIPQAIVVDVKSRTFYQNETYVTIYDFLQGIENGEIEEREQEDNSGRGVVEKVKMLFVRNMPMSAIILVLSLIVMFLLLSLLCFDDDDMDDSEEMIRRMQIERQISYGNKHKAKRKTVKED